MAVIKTLKGHSGSTVTLRIDVLGLYVQKNGNVDRNYERMKELEGIIDLPEIYSYGDDVLKMEYIHGMDMKNYLLNNTSDELLNFIVKTLALFAEETVDKDYTSVYDSMLSFDMSELPFTKQELMQKLPKVLPQSLYHGDMTLENIIFREKDEKFVFIDPVTVPFDSFVFDIAKLRQDLKCGWFLRHDKVMLGSKLSSMQTELLDIFPIADNDYLLILMLLRVYKHCEKNTLEYDFIIREVNRLWK